MKAVFNNSEFFEENKKTIRGLMKSKTREVCGFGDLQLIEINRWNGRKDHFNKYLWIFHNGENVTPLVGLFLNKKVSNSKEFCGAFKNQGYGYRYSSYVMEHLINAGYKNFEQMLLALVTSGVVKIEK